MSDEAEREVGSQHELAAFARLEIDAEQAPDS
jgi:hypothetical protein